MTVSRKVVILLLASTILLGIALRYPLVDHERFQTDSYFIHYLSQSIVTEKRADWTFTFLSYFGYFPLSYPTGTPFLIAELADLTGTTVEVSILMSNLLFSVLFCFVVFCLVREFTRRPEFVLLATFFAAVGPRFVDTTYWDGSARGPAIVMISALVFVLYRAGFTHQFTLYIPAFLIGVGSFFLHHMAVLVVVFAIAHIFATLGSKFLKKVPIAHNKRLPVLVSGVVVATLALLIMGYFGMLGSLFISNFGETGTQSSAMKAISLFFNIAVSYTQQIGIVLVIAVLATVQLLRRSFLETKTLFPIAVLVCFLPLLGNSIYVSMMLSPFVAAVAVIWMGPFVRRRISRKLVAVAFVLLLAGSVALPVFSVNRWNAQEYTTGDKVEVKDQVFNDAAYLSSVGRGQFAVSNSESLTLEMQALSGLRFMRSGVPSVVNGDVTKEDVYASLSSSEATFPGNLYMWFQYKEEYFIDGYVMSLMRTGTPLFHQTGAKVIEYGESHSHMIVVVDEHWTAEYVTAYGVFPAAFLGEVQSGVPIRPSQASIASYVVYRSEGVSTYFVGI